MTKIDKVRVSFLTASGACYDDKIKTEFPKLELTVQKIVTEYDSVYAKLKKIFVHK